MKSRAGRYFFPSLLFLAALVLALPLARPVSAQSKFIRLDDIPQARWRPTVLPDGSRVFITSSDYLVFDDHGKLVQKIGFPSWGTSGIRLYPLPDGRYLSLVHGLSGHLAMCYPNGKEARILVGFGTDEKHLHGDVNWASPDLMAVDVPHQRIFILDATDSAPADTRHIKNPDRSRIAVFDFDGKYINQINGYSAYGPDRATDEENPDKHTRYLDIAVDPQRQHVYVLSATGKLMSFDYSGKPLNKIPLRCDALTVLPNGNIVAAGRELDVFDPDLKALNTVKLTGELAPLNIQGLDSDAQGRLYATTSDPSIIYVRWSADMSKTDIFHVQYLRVEAEFPNAALTSGDVFTMKVRALGQPTPANKAWQVMMRPVDGSALEWKKVEVKQDKPAAQDWIELHVSVPAALDGYYEVAARYGEGAIAWEDSANDPSLEKVLPFVPQGAAKSVSVVTDSGRRAFQQGEAIPLEVVPRTAPGKQGEASTQFHVSVNDAAGKTILSTDVPASGQIAMQVSGALTRQLLPGRYTLSATAEGFLSHPLPIQIATPLVDSPVQRILYCEFAGGGTAEAMQEDLSERQADIRDYAAAEHRLGFTRETDRLLLAQVPTGPRAWMRESLPVDNANPALGPGDYYAIPSGSSWAAEYFYDQGVGYGLRFDSHLLSHCSGVRFTDPWLEKLDPVIQRSLQWLQRYPSLYGINYNDEMFFAGYGEGWTKDDTDALDALQAEHYKGKPWADVYMAALRRMYDSFNAHARQADPSIKLTVTPMWQFPASDGSYPPTVYQGMDETFSHYMSEGEHVPWFAPHSAEMLRRPGLPLMAVIDNGHHGAGGDLYLMDSMQVLARGAQGTGQALTNALSGPSHPYGDPTGADAYRTANTLAAMYGAVFAQATPVNEGYVLYSYTQDATEKRHSEGTPHWERVYGMYSAGLMAGVPMQITYEEDVRAGQLMNGAATRVPMLFLVGQTQALPADVMAKIKQFQGAGGKVFIDADCAENIVPGATRLNLHASDVSNPMADNMNNDAWFPAIGAALEPLAKGLRQAVGSLRRYPMDTNDLWVSKNSLDGGDIRYVMVASESSPYPWDAGTAWGLGARFFRNYLPKTVELNFPSSAGTVYDVFEHAPVKPEQSGSTSRLAVNLRTFPGRLYAITPSPMGAPRIETGVTNKTLYYKITAMDEAGHALHAIVPLRIRLLAGNTVAAQIYRGTELGATPAAEASYSDSLNLPLDGSALSLEVTELISGKSSASPIASEPAKAVPAADLVRRPDAEVSRDDRLRELLGRAKKAGHLTLYTADDKTLDGDQVSKLGDAVKALGMQLNVVSPAPKESAPGVYLAAGYMPDPKSMGDVLQQAREHGQFGDAVSAIIPGPGRGLVTAIYSARGYDEDAIALLGGDSAGLGKAVDAFISWLKEPAHAPDLVQKPQLALTSKPLASAPLPALKSMVGVKLGEMAMAADGKHLLVTAPGFQKNLAVVVDGGESASVESATRAGQGPNMTSLYINGDGSQYGADVRAVARYGEGFHLMHANAENAAAGSGKVFAAFGQYEGFMHHFAASTDGATVIAPGEFGYVCWKHQADGWKEAWSYDYWKFFQQLDWPISASDERLPQFQAYIPRGADYAIIVFGETTNDGWVTSEFHYKVAVWAVGLADGKQRWRFDVPVQDQFLSPTLYTSPDGSKLLLMVQIGSFGKEKYRFYSLSQAGTVLGTWDSASPPVGVSIADKSGRVAEILKDRLLEIRQPDGTLIHNALWEGADPLDSAFTPDGTDLYVADSAGLLTRLDGTGQRVWQTPDGGVARLISGSAGVYAAGWDGRLRAFADDGKPRWTIDLTPYLDQADPMAQLVKSEQLPEGALVEAQRPSTTSHSVPAGPNLITPTSATVTVGGTPGYDSVGKVLIKAAQLTNGQTNDGSDPWILLADVNGDGAMGRQVWAEIDFKKPTDVHSVTVYENPDHPESFPTEGLVQYWNDQTKAWTTASRGVFMSGPVNTYPMDLKGISKLRYAPWNGYCHNFYTSEIEVR